SSPRKASSPSMLRVGSSSSLPRPATAGRTPRGRAPSSPVPARASPIASTRGTIRSPCSTARRALPCSSGLSTARPTRSSSRSIGRLRWRFPPHVEREEKMAGAYDRDLIGYGANPPDPKWPGGARLAVNFVINYEEGSEPSIQDGEEATEIGLTEAR